MPQCKCAARIFWLEFPLIRVASKGQVIRATLLQSFVARDVKENACCFLHS